MNDTIFIGILFLLVAVGNGLNSYKFDELENRIEELDNECK